MICCVFFFYLFYVFIFFSPFFLHFILFFCNCCKKYIIVTINKTWQQVKNKKTLSSKYSCPELNTLVTYHTLPSLHVCVWLVNTLTLTVPIGSLIICTWAPADICEQWEGNSTTQFSRHFMGNEWWTPKNVYLGG